MKKGQAKRIREVSRKVKEAGFKNIKDAKDQLQIEKARYLLAKAKLEAAAAKAAEAEENNDKEYDLTENNYSGCQNPNQCCGNPEDCCKTQSKSYTFNTPSKWAVPVFKLEAGTVSNGEFNFRTTEDGKVMVDDHLFYQKGIMSELLTPPTPNFPVKVIKRTDVMDGNVTYDVSIKVCSEAFESVATWSYEGINENTEFLEV